MDIDIDEQQLFRDLVDLQDNEPDTYSELVNDFSDINAHLSRSDHVPEQTRRRRPAALFTTATRIFCSPVAAWSRKKSTELV